MSERPVLLVVLGTRPEAIKLGTVIPLLRKSAAFRTVVMWTGQHPLNELGKVAELFAIKPDVVLPDGAMERGEWTLAPEDLPHVVLVQGDTRSTAFGALIAERLGAKLIHLEAGLRCWDMTLPEEQIRVAVDEQADLLLCSTKSAEGNAWVSVKNGGDVHWVGQTGIDALIQARGEDDDVWLRARRTLSDQIGCDPDDDVPWIEDGMEKVLVTIHRAARTETPDALRTLVRALAEVAVERDVLWPVHPRIHKAARADPAFAEILREAQDANIILCKPLPYEVLAPLIDAFDVVITDSGGLVEECAVLGVPCVIARPNTERVEAVGAGCAVLCPDDAKIAAAVGAALMTAPTDVFRDYGEPGEPSRNVLDYIERFFEDLQRDFLSPPDPKDSPDA